MSRSRIESDVQTLNTHAELAGQRKSNLVELKSIIAQQDSLPVVVAQPVRIGNQVGYCFGLAYRENNSVYVKVLRQAIQINLTGNQQSDYLTFVKHAVEVVPSVLGYLNFSEQSLFGGHSPNHSVNHRPGVISYYHQTLKAAEAMQEGKLESVQNSMSALSRLGSPVHAQHLPHHTSSEQWIGQTSKLFERTGGSATITYEISAQSPSFLAILNLPLARKARNAELVVTPDTSLENATSTFAIAALGELMQKNKVQGRPLDAIATAGETLEKIHDLQTDNPRVISQLYGMLTGKNIK